MQRCSARYDWGRYLWGYIHTICVIDTEDMKTNVDLCIRRLYSLKELIPCETCFKEFYRALEKLDEIDIYKPMEMFRWSWRVHNTVNNKLGKPEIEYEDALELYAIKN